MTDTINTLPTPTEEEVEVNRQLAAERAERLAAEQQKQRYELAAKLGSALMLLAAIFATIGVIGALILAFHEVEVGGRFTAQTERPFVLWGMGLAFVTAVQAAFLGTVGAVAAAWASEKLR